MSANVQQTKCWWSIDNNDDDDNNEFQLNCERKRFFDKCQFLTEYMNKGHEDKIHTIVHTSSWFKCALLCIHIIISRSCFHVCMSAWYSLPLFPIFQCLFSCAEQKHMHNIRQFVYLYTRCYKNRDLRACICSDCWWVHSSFICHSIHWNTLLLQSLSHFSSQRYWIWQKRLKKIIVWPWARSLRIHFGLRIIGNIQSMWYYLLDMDMEGVDLLYMVYMMMMMMFLFIFILAEQYIDSS